jgi:hypothetical protein
MLSENTIYRKFCPMAFGGEGGYWLSSNEEIMNPYFGDKIIYHKFKVEVITPLLSNQILKQDLKYSS